MGKFKSFTILFTVTSFLFQSSSVWGGAAHNLTPEEAAHIAELTAKGAAAGKAALEAAKVGRVVGHIGTVAEATPWWEPFVIPFLEGLGVAVSIITLEPFFKNTLSTEADHPLRPYVGTPILPGSIIIRRGYSDAEEPLHIGHDPLRQFVTQAEPKQTFQIPSFALFGGLDGGVAGNLGSGGATPADSTRSVRIWGNILDVVHQELGNAARFIKSQIRVDENSSKTHVAISGTTGNIVLEFDVIIPRDTTNPMHLDNIKNTRGSGLNVLSGILTRSGTPKKIITLVPQLQSIGNIKEIGPGLIRVETPLGEIQIRREKLGPEKVRLSTPQGEVEISKEGFKYSLYFINTGVEVPIEGIEDPTLKQRVKDLVDQIKTILIDTSPPPVKLDPKPVQSIETAKPKVDEKNLPPSRSVQLDDLQDSLFFRFLKTELQNVPIGKVEIQKTTYPYLTGSYVVNIFNDKNEKVLIFEVYEDSQFSQYKFYISNFRFLIVDERFKTFVRSILEFCNLANQQKDLAQYFLFGGIKISIANGIVGTHFLSNIAVIPGDLSIIKRILEISNLGESDLNPKFFTFEMRGEVLIVVFHTQKFYRSRYAGFTLTGFGGDSQEFIAFVRSGQVIELQVSISQETASEIVSNLKLKEFIFWQLRRSVKEPQNRVYVQEVSDINFPKTSPRPASFLVFRNQKEFWDRVEPWFRRIPD